MEIEPEALARHKRARPDLVSLEYEALARLLRHWARRFLGRHLAGLNDEEANQTLLARVVNFRDGVIYRASQGSPGKRRETVPHEIAQDEYLTVHIAVESVIKRARALRDPSKVAGLLRSCDVTYPIRLRGRAVEVRRPFPCPGSASKSVVNELLNRSSPPSVVTLAITAARLDSTPSTIKALRAKRREEGLNLEPRTPEQRLLASLFLDCVSFAGEMEVANGAARLLDALASLDYPSILLYYLVQFAHSLPTRIALAPCSDAVAAITRLFSDVECEFSSSEAAPKACSAASAAPLSGLGRKKGPRRA